MERWFATTSARLGLRPREAARLNPAELRALWEGYTWRSNREAERLAWFLCFIGPAVRDGIAAAFGERDALKGWRDVKELSRTAPGYLDQEG